eukprot:CAMPEP_0204505612 /NCGR_PEP_ID=MMETSP0471-20130131/108027_1 /ASSEMBLY_ACC=CAM_ASM_000602 /TAXON_ID=2969 /ORGANISM="Oxyrrhis marina" /LENGTH=53 /DNA_ID=CAMNT_0051510577 /DNA_START=117 /DNA_END=278 /DNA_ORIENTATION=-
MAVQKPNSDGVKRKFIANRASQQMSSGENPRHDAITAQGCPGVTLPLRRRARK